MIEVIQSATFTTWINGLRDREAVARITARIRRMTMGNFGDVEPVGEGVSEARIHHGAGYRVYFIRTGKELIVLLCGGDKKSQNRDIKLAREMAKDWG